MIATVVDAAGDRLVTQGPASTRAKSYAAWAPLVACLANMGAGEQAEQVRASPPSTAASDDAGDPVSSTTEPSPEQLAVFRAEGDAMRRVQRARQDERRRRAEAVAAQVNPPPPALPAGSPAGTLHGEIVAEPPAGPVPVPKREKVYPFQFWTPQVAVMGADQASGQYPMDPVDLAPERAPTSGPRHPVDAKWPLTPEETLDPARIAADNAVLDALIADEQKKRAEAERLAAQAEAPPQAPVPAPASPPSLPSAPVQMPQAVRLAIAAGAPVAALTTRDLGPNHVADLLGADAAKRRDAQVARQASVTAAWQAQPKPLTTELDAAHLGEREPVEFATASNATAAGCASPVAAGAILHQVLLVSAAVKGKALENQAGTQAAIREVRAVVAELGAQGPIEGMLAAHITSMQMLLQKIAFRMAADAKPADMVMLGTALEKVTRVQLDLIRARDRLRRGGRRRRTVVRNTINVQDRAQAVINAGVA